MEVFTYPFFFKIFYRYGNIPITLLLIIYLIPSVSFIDEKLIYLFPIIITFLIIYFLNKQFINFYKIVPYKISADESKIICQDFLFSKKEIVIYFDDIESLKGGIFEGKLRGILKVCDGKNKICIGYFNKLKNSQKLGTILLSKVNKNVYNEVITKITEAGTKYRRKKTKKKK